jgi:peptide/nickel transport system permease protein
MGMKAFIIRRIVVGIPLIFVILVLNFMIMRLAPGDPVSFLISGIESEMPPGYVLEIKAKYGFDQPLYIQLFRYMGNVLMGDLGFSFFYHKPVLEVIYLRLGNTLLLSGTAFILAVLIGVQTGIVASKRPYSLTDNVLSVTSLITWSMPYFWMGMVFILIFSMYLGLFPVQGMITPGLSGSEYWLDLLWHLSLPATVLALGQFALYTRFTRASMLEVLRKDYILTAWSKGATDQMVYYVHAFKNALLPIVTLIGLQVRHLFTGAMLVETIFAWPGMGRLVYESIFFRDYNLVMAVFLVYSIITIVSNIVTDIAYGFLDPRIRYK